MRIISGDDAGITQGKRHGIFPEAVLDLAAGGVSVVDALITATSGAARACGVGDRKGRLRAGFDADLLVVDGDVGVDPTALAVGRHGPRRGDPGRRPPALTTAHVAAARLVKAGRPAHHGRMAGPTFRDRVDAGTRLAVALGAVGERDGVVVLGLPRGGVVVAAEVARGLGAPLDVLVVRKVGVPGHEELAAGAVASGGTTVVNDDVLAATGIGRPEMEQRAAERHRAVEEMEQRLRGDRAALDLHGTTAVLVDDGLATGATMRAAAVAARRAGAAWVVVAAPVASPEAVRLLEELADEVVCLSVPVDLRAVGLSYRDFSPVREEEVRRLLQSAQ